MIHRTKAKLVGVKMRIGTGPLHCSSAHVGHIRAVTRVDTEDSVNL